MTSDDIDFMLFGSRTCVCCGREYPANTEHFGRDNSNDGGLKTRCKRCVSEAGREAYWRHRAAKAARA